MKMFSVGLILLLLLPLNAQADEAGAITMQFNTSARAAGMGDAGVANVWGMDTDHWANPALLAFRPGIAYRSFESHLATGLADDIWLTNKEMTFGAYGVTFLLARGPLDGNHLDLGTQVVTDENGDITGEIHQYEESQSWGVGVDAVQVAARFLDLPVVDLDRYVSLAGGIAWHDYHDLLAPAQFLQDSTGSGSAEGSAKSLGYVLRVTPVDWAREAGPGGNGIFGLKAQGAYGASILNKTDDLIMYPDATQGKFFPRRYLSGWSVNGQLTFADDLRATLNDIGFGFLGDVINPLVSYTRAGQVNDPGYVWDGESYHYEHDTSGEREVKNRGWELGLANIYFIRRGHITARYGDIDGDTEGTGWNIQAGRLGGFRKDWADVPQAQGLPTVHRETWTVWVDPVAIADTFF